MNTPLLEMQNITKEFPGVKALNNVSFRVAKGEIHCLVGENGAGKSTLMKVLSGVYPYGEYSGDILFGGDVQKFRGIRDSEHAGIAIIYQELALVPELTVYENIFLGNEIRRGVRVDWNETIKRTNKMLETVRLDVNPAAKVKDLGVGKQQLVEIADTVTVLRDGQTICTLDAHKGEVSENILVKHMVGREIDNIYPHRPNKQIGEVVLEAKIGRASRRERV